MRATTWAIIGVVLFLVVLIGVVVVQEADLLQARVHTGIGTAARGYDLD